MRGEIVVTRRNFTRKVESLYFRDPNDFFFRKRMFRDEIPAGKGGRLYVEFSSRDLLLRKIFVFFNTKEIF